MSREDFLQGLENALSGSVPPSVVRENLSYYSDYIRTEMGKGRSEADVMEELGDPRLIARTIMDTTPGGGEAVFEEYHSRGAFTRAAEESRRYEDGTRESYQEKGHVHYYDLSKWYWKLLGILLVIAVVAIVITVVTGILSLVIPLLPVIGLVIVIMWFVRGSGR